MKVNEHMSPRARKYQLQETGHTGEAYKYNGIKFDGIENSKLLETKGPGFRKFIAKDGTFQWWFRGKEALLDQAATQAKVAGANGMSVEWRVAEREFADALRQFFKGRGVTVTVVHKPMLP